MTWRLLRKANVKWCSLGRTSESEASTTTKVAEVEDHTGMRDERTRYGPMKWKYYSRKQKSVSRTLKQKLQA